MVLLPGDVVDGRYRIGAVAGRGGTSIVYRATHLALERPVALKVLSVGPSLLPEHVVRLAREARAASRMRNGHVVRIFDAGRVGQDRRPYLVMELLEGRDLAAALADRGRFPVPLALTCIMHACEGLAEAHALGVVHRDLKPANLFLTLDEAGAPWLKVLDFGISRAVGRSSRETLTDPGTVVGTPSYMAPEQMESSEVVDPIIDIWALGAILHELLVGAPPFKGDTLPQIFLQILRTKPPRPSSLRSDVPASIDAVVARCLSVAPADRYRSVAELASDLERVERELRGAAPRARRARLRHARGAPSTGEVVLLLAALGAAAALTLRDAASSDVAPATTQR